MKIYLAGPIMGIPKDNQPLFEAMEALFTLRGHHVCNPHFLCKDIAKEADPSIFMRRCLDEIMHGDYDMLYALKGWPKSRGSLAEIVVAMSIGLWVVAEANEHESIYSCQYDMVKNYPSRRAELVPTYSENVNNVLERLGRVESIVRGGEELLGLILAKEGTALVAEGDKATGTAHGDATSIVSRASCRD